MLSPLYPSLFKAEDKGSLARTLDITGESKRASVSLRLLFEKISLFDEP